MSESEVGCGKFAIKYTLAQVVQWIIEGLYDLFAVRSGMKAKVETRPSQATGIWFLMTSTENNLDFLPNCEIGILTNAKGIPNVQGMPDRRLIDRVKLTLDPKNKNWVLFTNGTVIVFNDAQVENNLEDKAMGLMKKFGPVHVGTSAGDFDVVPLNETEGWMVTGHCNGMNTHVHPNEIRHLPYGDLAVGVYGRSKRHRDSSANNFAC